MSAGPELSATAGLGVSAELGASGISIKDQFASAAEVFALRECAQLHEARGDFAPARVGAQGAEQRRDTVRGDFTCWLSEPLLPPERLLLRRMEALRLQLNSEAFLGLFELELHYARYQPVRLMAVTWTSRWEARSASYLGAVFESRVAIGGWRELEDSRCA